MTVKFHVRRGDEVVVTSGKDRGKQGEIIKVLPKVSRVIVRGVNMVKKHMKASAANPSGGIVEKEASIHISNVMHSDPESGKPTRIGYRVLKDGRKVRYAKKSDATIESNRA